MVTENATIFTVTDRAAEKAQNLMQERGLGDGALRVFVVSGGCSGYSYGMALANEPEEGDTILEYSGVRFLIDADSAPMLQGAEVDYVDDVMKSGFSIYNPNAVKSCACGSSFQTEDGSGQAKSCC